MGFQVGDSVGEYKIAGVIGSGGMGRVFRVEHAITQRVEAMKVLLETADQTDELAQRFLREIQLQARLNHPNIAAVHHAFWARERLVMVMELVDGESLEAMLERGRIPLGAGIDYARQALAALAYAHAHGVTHRDIKPPNIMVTAEGVVKLTDFGLAKTPADPRLTRSGAMLGSAYYMSPEQVKANITVDARTDIYSLGVVLYELTTGRKPFVSDSAFEVMQAHVNEPPPPPPEVEPQVPAALNEVILTALAKTPAQRFQSAGAFRSALEAAAAETAPARARRWRRLVLLPAGAAVGVGLLVVVLNQREQQTEPPAEKIRVAAERKGESLPARPAGAMLPAGTPLRVRTSVTLSTNLHRTGQNFMAQLDEAVTTRGQLVADRGAMVEGRIAESDRGGRIAGRARLAIQLTKLRTAAGFVAFSTEPVEVLARGPGARRALLRRGPPAVLPADSVVEFRVRPPARTSPASSASADPR